MPHPFETSRGVQFIDAGITFFREAANALRKPDRRSLRDEMASRIYTDIYTSRTHIGYTQNAIASEAVSAADALIAELKKKGSAAV